MNAEEIVQKFLLRYFEYSRIQEVRGLMFLQGKSGKWTTDGDDIWCGVERIVDSIASRSCSESEKLRAVGMIMVNFPRRAPTTGTDILRGLVRVGFKIVPPVMVETSRGGGDDVSQVSGCAPTESV
jgi:hypothetical protein